jgi:AcrR family transcriptional regulator
VISDNHRESVERAHSARDRILSAAYDLFTTRGTRAVGVDSIIAHSGVAKMTLYRHFRSKSELVQAFLQMREKRWSVEWMQAEVESRAAEPEARLLAIFDVFHEWFQVEVFEGCPFINVLLEYPPRDDALHMAAAAHLVNIRSFLKSLAEAAHLDEVENFAGTWHILMKGSIVAGCEGNRNAARLAQGAARSVLAGWPRQGSQ